MRVLLFTAAGLALVLLQGSKIFSAMGVHNPPDFVLVYLVYISAYSGISPELLVFISFLTGMVVDVMSGSLLLSAFVYPAVTVLFLVFRDRFLQLSFVVKSLLFLAVNTGYVFFNRAGIYVYSGQFSGLSDKDLYTFINNLILFYTVYFTWLYLNEKTAQKA